MSFPILTQPTDTSAVTTAPVLPPHIVAESTAYQHAVAWLQEHVNGARMHSMEWLEHSPYTWPDPATRPLRFWTMTAGRGKQHYAIDIGLNLDDSYTVNGALVEVA